MHTLLYSIVVYYCTRELAVRYVTHVHTLRYVHEHEHVGIH